MFKTLDDEWRRLIQQSATQTALKDWCESATRPPKVDSLDGLVELVRLGGPEGQAMARCLVDHAQVDAAAARVMLQVLLPSLVRLARRSGGQDPEAAGSIVGLAWIRIRTYPNHRPGNVAANLAWDIRKHYLRSQLHQDYPLDRADQHVAEPSAEMLALNRLMVDEARSELNRLSGSELSFELIWSTRVDGRSSKDVARGCGMSRHALIQRRRRAEQALRAALNA